MDTFDLKKSKKYFLRHPVHIISYHKSWLRAGGGVEGGREAKSYHVAHIKLHIQRWALRSLKSPAPTVLRSQETAVKKPQYTGL
jgi:hypothetical protein